MLRNRDIRWISGFESGNGAAAHGTHGYLHVVRMTMGTTVRLVTEVVPTESLRTSITFDREKIEDFATRNRAVFTQMGELHGVPRSVVCK